MSMDWFSEAKDILINNRKRIGAAIIIAVIAGVVFVGAGAALQVKGVVTGVGDNCVTVANFFRTQTVNLAGAPIKTSNIKVGDSIIIQKNLHGVIIYAKILPARNEEDKHKDKEQPRRMEREYQAI